jgi:hypothetical protein
MDGLAPQRAGRQSRLYSGGQLRGAPQARIGGVEGPPQHSRLDIRLKFLVEFLGLGVPQAADHVKGP